MESDRSDESESITRAVPAESKEGSASSHAANDIDLERLLYDPEYRQMVRGALNLGG